MNEKQNELIEKLSEILNYFQDEVLEDRYIYAFRPYIEKLLLVKKNRELIKRLK